MAGPRSWFRRGKAPIGLPPGAAPAPVEKAGQAPSSTSGSTSPTQTIGAPGYSVRGGWLDSTETSPDLRGTKKWVTFGNAIANEATLASGIRFCLTLGAMPSWSVETADDSPEAQDAADYVEAVMHDMATPWAQVVKRHLFGGYVGYALSELTAKVRADGRWGIDRCDARPQHTIERWEVDEHGNVTEFIQRAPQDQSVRCLPRGRLLYTVDDSLTDSPEGMGRVRHTIEAIRKKSRYVQLEGTGYETDLRGMPVVRGPWAQLHADAAAGIVGADAQLSVAKTAAETFLDGGHQFSKSRGMRLDSAKILDTSGNPTADYLWTIDTVRGDAQAATQVDVAIARLDREIARVLGTEGMLLTGGSLALSRDKTLALAVQVNSQLKQLAAEFLRDIFEHFLWPLEGRSRATLPRLVPGPVRVDDVEQLAGMLANIAAAGMPLQSGSEADLAVVNAMHDIAQLPRRDPPQGVGLPSERPAWAPPAGMPEAESTPAPAEPTEIP